VEFDYETDGDGVAAPTTTFAFDPDACFVTDDIHRLDFTLIAIGPRLSGQRLLQALGYMVLSDATDKHMLGEIANIIQHPQGGYKQLVVRENNIISRDETDDVLHYLADTEPGSSGSPVSNNDWEPIALHHWGEPHLELQAVDGQPLRKDVNEGIRVSSIVKALKARAEAQPATRESAAIAMLLQVWGASPRSGPVVPPLDEAVAVAARTPRAPAGPVSATSLVEAASPAPQWALPIEVSVKLPGIGPLVATPAFNVATLGPALAPGVRGAERKSAPAEDFSDRNGYEPGFIRGYVVSLPDWSEVTCRVALNQQALRGEDPHELRYHHFSVVMNADRRLALFTACNIDGRRMVAINRRDKTVNTSPTLSDLGIEALGPEASDDFSPDPRVLAAEQMTVEFYQDQAVPGYPKPPYPGRDAPEDEQKRYHRAMSNRTARMFQKGHITLRSDPSWGTADQALLAERDTFFYTNAAPQLGYFNQGSPAGSPGAKGKLRWRSVETFVERNAVTMGQRVTVFAGPVFDDKRDPEYRFGAKIPMQFWKIAVWKGDSGLQSLALLADQRPVLEQMTQGMPEAYDDDEELARVSEFVSTVAEIERLTGLRFDEQVRSGDIRLDHDTRESAWDFDVPA